jgi:hypothetical protein
MSKKTVKSNVVKLSTKSPIVTEKSWLFERIERGRNGIFSEIVTVTPEIAKRILENNENNRNVSEAQVAKIASDIMNDNWEMNGETIIISVDGQLNDGTHRLLAIVKANKAVDAMLVFGLPRNSRMSVDTGRSRKTSDFLKMSGALNANYAAAVARIWYAFSIGDYLGRSVTKQETIHFYEKNKTLIDYAVSYARSSIIVRNMGTVAIAVAYCMIHTVNSKDCETFFDSLVSGANLDQGSPILWLRQKLVVADKKLRAENRAEIILRYWNHWRTNTVVTRHVSILNKIPTVEK